MTKQVSHHENGGHELWFWERYTDVRPDDWRWPNFTPSEMRCRKTNGLLISPAFMDKAQSLRSLTGIAMPVNSGWRSPEHNASVSHTKSFGGPHPDAQAFDIRVRGPDAYNLMFAAASAGFVGIGPKQHGESRYIHLDTWWWRKQPALWTYDDD